MSIGLAVQSPVRVKANTIRLEALVWGRMFVLVLEEENDDDDDANVDVEYRILQYGR
jgi:hypothetical protein